MNGVEILGMIDVPIKFAFNEWAFYIVSGIVFIAFIYRGLHAWLSENFTFTAALVPIIIGAGISIICGFWAGILAKTPLVYESHYKVTINE